MRGATVPAGWTAGYGVNGLGQRLSKSAASLPTGVNRYFYDNDGNLLGEYDATGARIQEISYLAQPGEGPGTAIPVAINRAGTHFFINPDHLNSARSIGYARETADEAEKRVLDSLPPERRDNVDVVLVRFAMEGEVVADAF